MKKKYIYLIVIFLIVASCAAFGRIAGNDFINFDDDQYITKNNHIQSGIDLQNIKWAFTAVVVGNWHPLTLLSHMLDWNLFGANAGGHHIVSLLLHIGAVIFLFLFLNKTTNSLWPSAFAASLFALHPLRVESVAWAAERKDVLSMFFGMATLYAYAFYAEKTKITRYLLCLTLFILALMSKPMLVTLPFVLMLLDYWPLGRWQKALDEQGKSFNPVGRLIWEKIPFICLTIASSIATIWAQNKDDAFTSMEHLSFFTRFANAIISYVSYLEKTFRPVDLAVFYPYKDSFSSWPVLLFLLILFVITIFVIYYIKKIPFLFVGWFWYLGTLLPVIGLVQVSIQAMADRYTYLPSIGIAIMMAWGIPSLIKIKDAGKKILFPAAIVVLIIMSFLTWKQCGYWNNSFELFNHTLLVTKNNDVAHSNLASALFEEGNFEKALDHYNKAIHISPKSPVDYNNRGNAYAKLGQYQYAFEDFNEAIRLKPDYVDAYYNRGTLYGGLGQYQLAIESLSEAIRLKTDYTDAYNNRAFVYFNMGNIEYGCKDAKKACQLRSCAIQQATASKGLCR